MVVWQSGFVLAELLMRKPPLGPWTGVKVLDLGSGTGIHAHVGDVCGLAFARTQQGAQAISVRADPITCNVSNYHA